MIEQTLLNIEKDMQRVKIMGYQNSILCIMADEFMKELVNAFYEAHYKDIKIGILN